MNRAVNVTLVIFGIMALAFPPLGMVILTVAVISWRANAGKGRAAQQAYRARLAAKQRREAILIYKSFP